MASFQYTRELLLTCPYDRNHKIKPSRFDIHLIKCEKNSTKKLEICPFNNIHRIEPELFEHHLLECPNATSTIVAMVNAARNPEAYPSVKKPVVQQPDEVSELAEELGAAALEDTEPPPENKNRTDNGWDVEGWECDEPPTHYVIPGLTGDPNKAMKSDFVNPFALQRMKPAERKRLYERLNCRKEIEEERVKSEEEIKILEAMEKERREKLEQIRREEDEAVEKERQERERIKQEREKKKKAQKEKAKAAKRAAYLAKQAQDYDENENQDGE